jgi:hypothetical protein
MWWWRRQLKHNDVRHFEFRHFGLEYFQQHVNPRGRRIGDTDGQHRGKYGADPCIVHVV